MLRRRESSQRRRRRRRERKVIAFIDLLGKKYKPPAAYLEKHPLPFDVKKIVNSRGQDNSHIINLGSWREEAWKQTNPPCVPIDLQFPTKEWPVGEYQGYVNDQAYRNNTKEMLERDQILLPEKLTCLRRSAEVHRQVRKYAQSIAKPGIKMVDFCKNIEAVLR